MMVILRGNIEYLKGATPSKNQKINIQKLRNICLCMELLDNPELNKENSQKEEIKQLSRELLEEWDGWLSLNKNAQGLAGEMSKYLIYISKHFA